MKQNWSTAEGTAPAKGDMGIHQVSTRKQHWPFLNHESAGLLIGVILNPAYFIKQIQFLSTYAMELRWKTHTHLPFISRGGRDHPTLTSGMGEFRPGIFRLGYDGGGPYLCMAISHGGGTLWAFCGTERLHLARAPLACSPASSQPPSGLALTGPTGMPREILSSSDRSPGFFSLSRVSNSFP